MRLVERHIIERDDSRFALIDAAAFASKNLYNQVNYQVRQSFIHQGTYLNYAAIFHQIKKHESYAGLPRKVSNEVLRQLDRDWRAFFASMEEWREHPEKFLGRPCKLLN